MVLILLLYSMTLVAFINLVVLMLLHLDLALCFIHINPVLKSFVDHHEVFHEINALLT